MLKTKLLTIKKMIMKKVFLLATCAFLSISALKAQKLVEGSLAFLKNEKQIHFVFDYTDMKVDGDPEEKYVAKEVKDKNKDKKGSGDEWKKKWETTYRTKYFQERFISDFNKETKGALEGGYFENAKYQAIIKTIDMDPGFYGGVIQAEAWVKLVVTITEKGSSDVLAKIEIKKAEGSKYDMVSMPVFELRIASAYGEGGEDLAEFLIKQIKKAK